LLDYKINTDSNATEAPWEFTWIYDDTSDIEAYARVFETLSRTGIPVDVAKSEFYNKLGLSIPQEGDELVTIKAPTAMI